MPSININNKFKKTILAIGVVLAMSGNMSYADDVTANDLLDIGALLNDIDSGKVTSLPDNKVQDAKKETKKEEVKPVDKKSDTGKAEDKVVPVKTEEPKATEPKKTDDEATNINVDAIIEKTEKDKKKEDKSADNDIVNIMNNPDEDKVDTKNDDKKAVEDEKSDLTVKDYIKNKEILKQKVETSTKFEDHDYDEDIDYVKEKARIIESERAAREAEIKRIAAIKYITKVDNVPVNNYVVSFTFNENKFFNNAQDKSIGTFKQYILTAKQKEDIAPESMPKNDYIKGYKNITEREVSVGEDKPNKYELGVQYIVQLLEFDKDNNRIRMKIDASNTIRLAQYIHSQNKADTLEEKTYDVNQTRVASETFWIQNAKKAKHTIQLGSGQELVVAIDNIMKANEKVEYKVIDPTDGKAAENQKILDEKAAKEKALEAEKEKVKEDAIPKDKDGKPIPEKKGFFGDFFKT